MDDLSRPFGPRFITALVSVAWLVLGLLTVSVACSPSLTSADRLQADSGEVKGTPINVLVQDFSFSIDVSQAEAGMITFIVTNQGSMHHDFAIGSPGVGQKTSMLEPGESASLTIELEPGTYTYICTIPGHEQLGMRGTFTVTSK